MVAVTRRRGACGSSKRARVAHGKRGSIRQVGHDPLDGRGMNAALAIHEDYAYVGSRTDGGHGEPFGGIMVVDIDDPDDPELRGEPIDPEPGESTRELRVWSSQEVLIVLNTNCGAGPTLHDCTIDSISNIRFYDISGRNAKHPRLLNEFKVETHEFFLWQDPKDPERALSSPATRQHMRGPRRGADVPVLGLGHLRRAGREGAGGRSSAGSTRTSASRLLRHRCRSRPAACTR